MEKMLLEDWRKSFIRESCQNTNTINNVKGNGAIKKLMLAWAYDILEDVQEVTNLTALAGIIMEKFYNIHLPKLIKATKSFTPDEDYTKFWATIKRKLKSQTDLRIMSCLQLASKMVFDKSYNAAEIQHSLNEYKEKYTPLDSVLSSELRVFKTIGYEVPLFSSSEIVEYLIEVICADYCIDKEYFYTITNKVINLIFITDSQISDLQHGCQSEMCNLWTRMTSTTAVIIAIRIMTGDENEDAVTIIAIKIVETMECYPEDIDKMVEFFMNIILT